MGTETTEFMQMILRVTFGVGGVFVLLRIPHWLHHFSAGMRRGWPSEKRAAIKRLLKEGLITSISYKGCEYYLSDEFEITIKGPFGEFTRCGKRNSLHTKEGSDELPAEVADVFDGYLDNDEDVMLLLWDPRFLSKLEQETKVFSKNGFTKPWFLLIGSA